MNKFSRLYRDLSWKILDPGGIHLKYYSAEPNVGDVLNTYMIPRIAGKRVHKSYTHRFQHLTAIGSLLEGVGPKSVIWGSGSINGVGPIRPVTSGQIYALRGKKSLALMETVCGESIGVPLGDPGLLMPMFYDPIVHADKKVGIIPHHSEKDIGRDLEMVIPEDHLIIDVALDPESFIRQIKRCKSVVSSSLHGLILADAYAISNKWISISDRLTGGDWKFIDYYSMTSTPAETPYRTRTVERLVQDLDEISQDAGISHYTGNRDDLLASFPRFFSKTQAKR